MNILDHLRPFWNILDPSRMFKKNLEHKEPVFRHVCRQVCRRAMYNYPSIIYHYKGRFSQKLCLSENLVDCRDWVGLNITPHMIFIDEISADIVTRLPSNRLGWLEIINVSNGRYLAGHRISSALTEYLLLKEVVFIFKLVFKGTLSQSAIFLDASASQ